MNIDKAKIDLNDQYLKFDFDEWLTLSKNDPQAFEQRRLKWCNRLIDSAPPPYQRRLSGLLFQVNMEKRRSANAMDSCLRISGLMWEKLFELRNELQQLVNNPPSVDPELSCTPQQVLEKSADILEFSASTHSREVLVRS